MQITSSSDISSITGGLAEAAAVELDGFFMSLARTLRNDLSWSRAELETAFVFPLLLAFRSCMRISLAVLTAAALIALGARLAPPLLAPAPAADFFLLPTLLSDNTLETVTPGNEFFCFMTADDGAFL